MTVLKRILFSVALLAVAIPVAAAISLSAVRPGNFSSASTPGVLVPLDSTGAVTLTLNAGAGGRRVLTYSAECSVDAPAGNHSAWLDIDVLVNGVAQPPTVGTADGFCGANGVAGFDHWTRHSITLVIPVRVGANTIQILARGNAGATGLWLGDSSLVVVTP
jgi:hypothetical protein